MCIRDSVHSGDLNAGHYYAFLRPTKDGHFYKFDDDKVIRATNKETLEENFGGEYANGAGMRQPYTRNYSTKRSMNAYMLVYIRKSRIDDVLISVGNEDVPAHLGKFLAHFYSDSYFLGDLLTGNSETSR